MKFQHWLESRYASLLTHGSLVALLAAEYALIIGTRFWIALIPCILIQHRVGILLHDYVHGIPFRRYKHSLWVLAAADALLVNFGLVEIFRGTHLSHHRWMNTDHDPGFWTEPGSGPQNPILRPIWRLWKTVQGDAALYFRFVRQPSHPHYVYVKPRRVLLGVALSAAFLAACFLAGWARLPIGLIVVQICLIPTLSLRAAIEHSSHRDDPNFANEYKVLLPLFNRNRHVHHHLEPALPWYLLRFRTPKPLPPLSYWTHWYHVFIRRDYVMMRPLATSAALQEKEGVLT